MSAANGSAPKAVHPKRPAPARKNPPRPTVCASCAETHDRDDMNFVQRHGILCEICFQRIVRPGHPRVPVPPSLFRRDGEKA